jgi:hypothetical protein
MHVAVLQSAYVPWRGYFDIIASVDLFVIYDDVQYSKGSWRNRNRLKTSSGAKWLTVPVKVTLGQPISEVLIDYGPKDWVEQHRGLIDQSLRDAPFYENAIGPWSEIVSARPSHLSALNVDLLSAYRDALDIRTPFADSRDYSLAGSATDRLLMLLKAVGATSYLSGPAASGYLDLASFRDAGIDLYYKNYDYAPYPQQGEGFQPDVSILDLLANLGPEAPGFVRTSAGDRKVDL